MRRARWPALQLPESSNQLVMGLLPEHASDHRPPRCSPVSSHAGNDQLQGKDAFRVHPTAQQFSNLHPQLRRAPGNNLQYLPTFGGVLFLFPGGDPAKGGHDELQGEGDSPRGVGLLQLISQREQNVRLHRFLPLWRKGREAL